MNDLYRATVKPANPGRTDAEVSLQEMIDDSVLVPVTMEPSNLAAVLVKHLPLISASQIVEVCDAFFGKVSDDG